ncbi:DUF6683 family protein [Costertonia aggregata]|uniref:Uncharacterized protein n=1 Tax=Costertonia aggregata TaxID=343403 RepID=A0A7H9AKZ3_9FLAO|nr:DUF6683 family protein [Costertonia aggregata]QLG44023.1 hypothetical protein HYG79_01205 [Costertonia aggregata]
MKIQLGFLLTFLFFHTTVIYSQISYSPNNTIRNTIRKEIWKELKLKTPQKQKFLLGLVFNSNEPFVKYEKAAKQRGWEPYEIATAAAFFRVVCSEVVQGEDYTETQYKQIYEQFKKDFSRDNIDSKRTDIFKQRKYDALILKAFWVASMFELAKKNSPEIQKLAEQLLQENPLVDSNSIQIQEEVDAFEDASPTVSAPNTQSPPLADALSKIEDVILRTVTSYGLNGVYINNEVNILYKNGDVFTNPFKPLESFDIAASKKKNPKKWDRWAKKGNTLYVTRSKNGKTYDWKKFFPLRKASKGFTLNGKFNTSDPFGGATVINVSTVVFDDKGRFAWVTVKGGSTNWKSIYSKSTSAGRYEINTYTITLKYNNGKAESLFFGLYPKDNEHFIIGSSHFVPVQK